MKFDWHIKRGIVGEPSQITNVNSTVSLTVSRGTSCQHHSASTLSLLWESHHKSQTSTVQCPSQCHVVPAANTTQPVPYPCCGRAVTNHRRQQYSVPHSVTWYQLPTPLSQYIIPVVGEPSQITNVNSTVSLTVSRGTSCQHHSASTLSLLWDIRHKLQTSTVQCPSQCHVVPAANTTQPVHQPVHSVVGEPSQITNVNSTVSLTVSRGTSCQHHSASTLSLLWESRHKSQTSTVQCPSQCHVVPAANTTQPVHYPCCGRAITNHKRQQYSVPHSVTWYQLPTPLSQYLIPVVGEPSQITNVNSTVSLTVSRGTSCQHHSASTLSLLWESHHKSQTSTVQCPSQCHVVPAANTTQPVPYPCCGRAVTNHRRQQYSVPHRRTPR